MNGIIWRFIDICRFRAGPQDVPASGFLLGLVLISYLFLGVLLQQQEFSLVKSFYLVFIDILLMAGFISLLLWLKTLTNRFLQTFTALIGCGVVLELIALPIILWQQQAISADEKGLLLMSAVLLWIWLLWNIGVIGHILRHALAINFQLSVALSLGYVVISFSVVRILMAR